MYICIIQILRNFHLHSFKLLFLLAICSYPYLVPDLKKFLHLLTLRIQAKYSKSMQALLNFRPFHLTLRT